MLYESNTEYLLQLINEVEYLHGLEEAYTRRAKTGDREQSGAVQNPADEYYVELRAA